MTQIDPVDPAAAPPAPMGDPIAMTAPTVARTSPAARAGIRYGMSLVAVLLGVYLLLNGSYGQFVSFTLQPQTDPLLSAQLFLTFLFGVVVVVFGLVVAPGSLARRLIGTAIFVVLVLLYAIMVPVYLHGGGGVVVQAIAQPSFMVTLGATAAWLLVRGRPAWSLVFVIAIVLIPVIVNALFRAAAIAGSVGVVNMAQIVLPAIFGIGIAWLGRAVAGSRAQPIG
jgi:hypothetical protein